MLRHKIPYKVVLLAERQVRHGRLVEEAIYFVPGYQPVALTLYNEGLGGSIRFAMGMESILNRIEEIIEGAPASD